MKLIKYEEDGFIKQSFIPHDMNVEDADKGIPNNPPDLLRLDWKEIAKELNNLLIERNLITLKDIAEHGSLQNTILSIIKPKIVELYKEHPGYVQSNKNGHSEESVLNKDVVITKEN